MSSFRQLMMRNKGGGTQTLNATVVGNPTISDDFIISNFLGTTNYVYTTISGLSSSDNWVAQVKVQRTGIMVGTNDVIRFHDGNDNFMGQLGYSYSQVKWWCWFCSIDKGIATSYAYSDYNVWYWFRLSYSNGYLTVKLSTTGAFEGEEDTLTYSYVSNYRIIEKLIFGTTMDGEYLVGAIDMKECWFKINDNIAWQGVI